NPILALGNGSLDGWYMSVDKIGLKFWKNAFKESFMNGKVVLPPSGGNYAEKDKIDYHCTLTKPANSGIAFEFGMELQDCVGFKAYVANAHLFVGSKIIVSGGGGNPFKAEAILSGGLTLSSPKVGAIPEIQLGGMKFTNMKISSSGSQVFSPGHFEMGIGA